MNTKHKGDAFEDVVFNHLQKWIDSGQSCFNKECCKIFQKKTLKTKSQIAKYEFDIVIEIYTKPTEKTPCGYILFECKDHTTPIPICNITDFGCKIQNIKGSKGVFVSKNEYQSGAISAAKENSIALVRYSGKEYDDFNFLLHRLVIGNQTKRDRLVQELSSHISKRTFIAEYECTSYIEPESLFRDLLNLPHIKNKVPYITDENFDSLCKSLVSKSEIPVKTDTLIKLINDNGFELRYQQDDAESLGLCDYINHTIVLNEQLQSQIHRYRFTLAHELGHIILHKKYFNDSNIEMIQDMSIDTSYSNYKDVVSILEIQANKFAACLLMPKQIFAGTVYVLKEKLGIPHPNSAMYLDNQPCNIKDYHLVCSKLADGFNVSMKAVNFRMLNLKLVEIHV